MTPTDFLLLQAACTWFLTGLIWIIQIVHYPLFDAVGSTDYVAYHTRHMRQITWIVAPVMLLESLLAVLPLFNPPSHSSPALVWSGLALLATIWISTALFQIPQHNTLARGFSPTAHRRLVTSNWIRTACWSTRAILLLISLRQQFLPN